MSRSRDNFAANLKRLRLAQLVDGKPMTQEQLAARAGVTATTIHRLEVQLSSPTWETAQMIAEALGIKAEDLAADPPARG